MAASEGLLAARELDEDRLSQLSDSVLGHILSFLPAFDAARAAVLSRRWRNIFAAVHTVSLDDRERPFCPGDGDFFPVADLVRRPLSRLVSAALIGRGGGGAPLRELRVAFLDLRGLSSAVVDRWLSCSGDDLVRLDLRLLGSVACSRGADGPFDETVATCGAEAEDLGDETIPAPARLFSCAALRSLRLGPSRLDRLPPPPASILLPSLETLLLTRVVGDGAVQRLVSACPRLADLTLEACAGMTALRVARQRLRRLALRCCHDLMAVTVDAAELRAFEYRGGAPGPAFLTFSAGDPPVVASCTLDFSPGDPPKQPSGLRDFLQVFAGVTHLHLKSARLLGFLAPPSSAAPPVFPEFTSLRRLELTGATPDKDANTVLAAVARVLDRTQSLETLSFFFLPEPPLASTELDCHDHEAVLDVHQLRYDNRHFLVPDGGADDTVPSCLRERVREINLVHHQGARSQRMLARFLLRHALVLDELWRARARTPLDAEQTCGGDEKLGGEQVCQDDVRLIVRTTSPC